MVLGKALNLLMFANAKHSFFAMWGILSGEHLKVDVVVIFGVVFKVNAGSDAFAFPRAHFIVLAVLVSKACTCRGTNTPVIICLQAFKCLFRALKGTAISIIKAGGCLQLGRASFCSNAYIQSSSCLCLCGHRSLYAFCKSESCPYKRNQARTRPTLCWSMLLVCDIWHGVSLESSLDSPYVCIVCSCSGVKSNGMAMSTLALAFHLVCMV